jgi:hypothetical protein
MKIIEERYPLHDLYRRQEISKNFTLWKVLVTSMVTGGPTQISNINSAFYYAGPTLGYLLGFSILLKSWIQFYIIFPIIAFILVLILFTEEVEDFYITIIQILLVWSIGFVIKFSWVRRLNELNYSWDYKYMKEENLMSDGKYVID